MVVGPSSPPCKTKERDEKLMHRVSKNGVHNRLGRDHLRKHSEIKQRIFRKRQVEFEIVVVKTKQTSPITDKYNYFYYR